MEFINPYLTIVEKINMLQNWIIVHSIIYYVYDRTIVSDFRFDDNCKQLFKMMHDYPKELKASKYYYVMHDFNGSTGFDLSGRLNSEDRVKFNRVVSLLLMRGEL